MRNEHVHTLRLMADMRDLVVHVCFFINDVALAVAVENTPSYTLGYVEKYRSKLMKRIPDILAMSRKNLDNIKN